MSTMLRAKEWLTVEEAAEELGISTGRIRQLLLRGKNNLSGPQLHGEKAGNTWVISRSELTRFKKLERPPGNPTFLSD